MNCAVVLNPRPPSVAQLVKAHDAGIISENCRGFVEGLTVSVQDVQEAICGINRINIGFCVFGVTIAGKAQQNPKSGASANSATLAGNEVDW